MGRMFALRSRTQSQDRGPLRLEQLPAPAAPNRRAFLVLFSGTAGFEPGRVALDTFLVETTQALSGVRGDLPVIAEILDLAQNRP